MPVRRLLLGPGLIIALLAGAAPATSQTSAPAAESAFVANPCPAVPEPLARRRAANGPPTPVSSAEREAIQKYTQYQQANDWPYLCRYRDENLALSGASRPRVVLMGDSITENWKQLDGAFFTAGILDRGISGQTSSQMVSRFYQDVIALRPRVVHIMAGTNDVAGNTGPMSDDQYRNNIQAMVDLAQAHKIKVILANIPPADRFWWAPGLRPSAKIRALNDWLRSYAKTRGVTFIDYHTALADPSGGLRREFGADGVHPSRQGYEVMDVRFMQALRQAERH